ncbi:uncharacterized protein LOC132274903 isoform X6 [Cornus florida]|uniref:uncharacterized protein LOC132274903 isoform X6 n=1 Tax=Cornus florida TaxID=4283 RepID=UPI0028A19688|nr:uncharacterized protein LOC132274903 isoform X6 [Cornus florida]
MEKEKINTKSNTSLTSNTSSLNKIRVAFAYWGDDGFLKIGGSICSLGCDFSNFLMGNGLIKPAYAFKDCPNLMRGGFNVLKV